MKIAVITCYDHPDYIRAVTLRAGLAACKGVRTIVIKNRHKGMLRYLEVPLRILRARFADKPDAYVITFRGYEMLPFVLLVKGRKPLVFDEFINAAEYLEEQNRLSTKSPLGKLFVWWYAGLLRRCRFILADTQAHANYSAKLCRLDIANYRAVPVGADETLFHPKAATYTPPSDGQFSVFYYATMAPLHGMQYVLDAAVLLAKTHPHIRFTISGGKDKDRNAVTKAQAAGANITHVDWIPFDQLPGTAIQSDLTLCGPFGNTTQAQMVITGKTYQFMACAVPVLVGRNQVTAQQLHDKQDCLMVPQGDAPALADALAWAAQHPKQLRQIAQHGRKLYEAQFSHAALARQLCDLVKELA